MLLWCCLASETTYLRPHDDMYSWLMTYIHGWWHIFMVDDMYSWLMTCIHGSSYVFMVDDIYSWLMTCIHGSLYVFSNSLTSCCLFLSLSMHCASCLWVWVLYDLCPIYSFSVLFNLRTLISSSNGRCLQTDYTYTNNRCKTQQHYIIHVRVQLLVLTLTISTWYIHLPCHLMLVSVCVYLRPV